MIMAFLSTNPLFSSIITLYTLLLLYFPSNTLQNIFSPVLISTFILLLYLLRLGASQEAKGTKNENPTQQIHDVLDDKDELGSDLGPSLNPFYEDSFLEWDVRAPLEVIYEAYEGEEGGYDDDVLEENRETQMAIMERYASLSMYYPETDTDTSSSEGDFPDTGEFDMPESDGFRWEEYDAEGLIEIALDGKRKCESEEENLIEIDFLRKMT